jgi:hypothetical protein
LATRNSDCRQSELNSNAPYSKTEWTLNAKIPKAFRPSPGKRIYRKLHLKGRNAASSVLSLKVNFLI